MWEALYARTVPIVRYDIAYRNFQELPILFVNDYSEVTEDFLNKKYKEMSEQEWDFSKLRISYWKEQILKDQK